MQYVGIDIGSEKHFVAIVDEEGRLLRKPTPFTESSEGYAKLLELLGDPEDSLVAMEATGCYWKNAFAALAAQGYRVALLNPSRTANFAAEEMRRTKTDALDAAAIARFAAQKKPAVTRLADDVTDELRELVRHRDRLSQQFGDRIRQLHRLVFLGFPELRTVLKSLDSELATCLLRNFPTAAAFREASEGEIANLRYDGRHYVGRELAKKLRAAAATSVGAHHGYAYRLQVEHACEDMDLLRRRLRMLDRDLEQLLDKHDVGKLLTTIPGIGPHTAARLVATFGDFSGFPDAAALASFVGVVPAHRHSGKRTPLHAGLTRYGDAKLRSKLWMPTLAAVQKNIWLRAYYEGLLARGKLKKVALVAAMRKLLAAIFSVAKNRKPFVLQLPPKAAAA